MKKFIFITTSVALLATAAIANDSENEQTIFQVDTNNSKVIWKAGKVTGEHTGTVMLDGGKIVSRGNEVLSADVSLNMTSITNADLANEQWNNKLVSHLKSDDFFSVEQHPQSHFEATGFSENQGNEEFSHTVKGKLTIKGITHEISFPVDIQINGDRLTANGTAKLDRTKWDIKYRSGSFFKDLGDNLIYDEFEIKFDLVAKTETVN